MLSLSKNFVDKPVMSLRTGGKAGHASEPIVNPNNLKIVGFHCDDKIARKQAVLLTQDIRDTLPQGYVIDDREVLSDPEDLVRLKDILEIDYQLVGKPVYTTGKQKVGKVIDWAAESETFYIQKLYVGRSLLKSVNQGQLSIDRSHIVEITDQKIVIQDILNSKKGRVPATAPIA